MDRQKSIDLSTVATDVLGGFEHFQEDFMVFLAGHDIGMDDFYYKIDFVGDGAGIFDLSCLIQNIKEHSGIFPAVTGVRIGHLS